ncbi:DUF4272 domain-containing protein [Flavivirga spongiicola]|uniref:DUF4272 domain-containing protein n=1 Tax=Flavivirga spongiicola TaxID=421621 RepID=A0ABU7XT61_9FLAO|nr:DUF4272 domain-containing protein [Flavivirga sp. MEBiC05379]MDO5978956.1 DUF4272 domain-containing protein [Flavivirga sp. MEBiC05379]
MKYLRIIILMGFLSSLFGCGQKSKNPENSSDAINPPMTKPVENISATIDQKERRSNSEKICKSNEIPIYKNPNSLFVEPEKNVKLRAKDEVVDRALALLYLGLKSEGLEQVHLDKMDKDFGISSKLTPTEKAYAFSENPTEQQKTNANWRYESLHVLLWSLGYIDELVYPNQMCHVADDVKIIYQLGADKFREQSKLRSKKEILDQADLILRFDWACVSARVKNENAPGGLNSSVVYERHYALNWLIKFREQDWDHVTTDT